MIRFHKMEYFERYIIIRYFKTTHKQLNDFVLDDLHFPFSYWCFLLLIEQTTDTCDIMTQMRTLAALQLLLFVLL